MIAMAPNLLINIDVDDLDKAVRFYSTAIGLRIGRRFGKFGVEMLGGLAPIYLLVKQAGTPVSDVTSQLRSYERHWTPIHPDFVVDDIEYAAQKAIQAGARLEQPITIHKWGRLALMADPFGHGFCLVQFLGRGYDEIADDGELIVRDERKADTAAIRDVTIAAFNTLEISNHTEQFIIEALRAAGALTLSLVAEIDGRIVGHIAFSPVTLSDGTGDWYGLGPLSVLPEYQRQGIGKALVTEGLSRLKALDARGCCLVGHPEYYRKFGFSSVPGLVVEGVPPEVTLALSFDGHIPQGAVTFHDAFMVDGHQVIENGT
jgi:putative acetyltransferase